MIKAILEGINARKNIERDLTLPAGRMKPLGDVEGDLVVIALPVYEEKVPKIVVPLLSTLRGKGRPVVLVAVYGNIAPGIMLKELEEIVHDVGFKVAAAGEFVAEHSFSTEKHPLAQGRPKDSDIEVAIVFGMKVAEKLSNVGMISVMEEPEISGHLLLTAKVLPPDSAKLFTEQPRFDPEICIDCGICAGYCPTGAIDPKSLEINEDECLRCFACVRRCPVSARRIKIKQRWITRFFFTHRTHSYKEPVFYI